MLLLPSVDLSKTDSDIPKDLLDLLENAILNKTPDATEAMLARAEQEKDLKTSGGGEFSLNCV